MLSVFNFEDPIDYVSAYITQERESNSSFSVRTFSNELGLRSSAPLIDILKRKKVLKDKLTDKIIDIIGLILLRKCILRR